MARILEGLIEVRRSPIQGKGVYALRAIAKGTRILEYEGERISSAEAEARYDDASAKRHHTFLFAVDDEWCVDATRVGNDAKFINHSCEPNCEAIIEKGRIFIEARRDIAPGSELAYDYWYRTDSTYTTADLLRMYPCKCGTKRCRGTLAAPKAKTKAKPAPKAKAKAKAKAKPAPKAKAKAKPAPKAKAKAKPAPKAKAKGNGKAKTTRPSAAARA